jgi:hypothetical protein
MNKVRIVGIVGSLLIVVVFLTKIDYSDLSWLRNGTRYGVIVAALVFSVSNIVTWDKKK